MRKSPQRWQDSSLLSKANVFHFTQEQTDGGQRQFWLRLQKREVALGPPPKQTNFEGKNRKMKGQIHAINTRECPGLDNWCSFIEPSPGSVYGQQQIKWKGFKWKRKLKMDHRRQNMPQKRDALYRSPGCRTFVWKHTIKLSQKFPRLYSLSETDLNASKMVSQSATWKRDLNV